LRRAALWSYGVLSREQLLAAVAAFGLWRLASIVRRRARFGAADAAWIAPFVVFAAWQLLVRHTDGQLPQFAGSASNIGPPVAGIVGSFGYWLSQLGDGLKGAFTNALTIYELALIVALVVFALLAELQVGQRWLRWMVVVVGLLALTVTRAPLDPGSDLRVFSDLAVLSWIVLLSSPPRPAVSRLAAVQVVGMAGAMAIRLASI
jgi:hypothetical protein